MIYAIIEIVSIKAGNIIKIRKEESTRWGTPARVDTWAQNCNPDVQATNDYNHVRVSNCETESEPYR